MVEGMLELAAMCVGLVGLIGAATTTGLPMWRVTAFIGPNIIVMENLWEGLWMNCFRQANIRMQCKEYDSLLFLPPELQASRGLMCSSVALSGVALLVGLAGMRCVSCLQGHERVKTIILMVAGAMQLMACICVLIPVSWTGHVIITNFYNPLVIDAEKRELGAALYIGWVTSAVLFASAMLFLCRRLPSDKGSYDIYPPLNLLGYKAAPGGTALMRYHPVSSVPSARSSSYYPSLPNSVPVGGQLVTPVQSVHQAMPNDGVLINPPSVYTLNGPENASLLYHTSVAHQPSVGSSNHLGNLYATGNSLLSQNTTPHTLTYTGNPTPMSYQSSFHPVPHTPVFIGYHASKVVSESSSSSPRGVYI